MVLDNRDTRFRFLLSLIRLSEVDPDATTNQLAILLLISGFDGELTASDIASFFHTKAPVISRTLDIWGDHGAGGRKGRGYIEKRDVDGDRRMKTLHLTKKGQKYLSSIMGAISRDADDSVELVTERLWESREGK